MFAPLRCANFNKDIPAARVLPAAFACLWSGRSVEKLCSQNSCLCGTRGHMWWCQLPSHVMEVVVPLRYCVFDTRVSVAHEGTCGGTIGLEISSGSSFP